MRFLTLRLSGSPVNQIRSRIASLVRMPDAEYKRSILAEILNLRFFFRRTNRSRAASACYCHQLLPLKLLLLSCNDLLMDSSSHHTPSHLAEICVGQFMTRVIIYIIVELMISIFDAGTGRLIKVLFILSCLSGASTLSYCRTSLLPPRSLLLARVSTIPSLTSFFFPTSSSLILGALS